MKVKKYWQGNLTLIIIAVLLAAGFFVIKNFWLEAILNKARQGQLSQTMQMDKNVKKVIDQGFNIKLFSQEQYKSLKEFILLPLTIGSERNEEPFKKIVQ